MALTEYTIASPNGGTWSIQSTNTSKTGRFTHLAILRSGASGSGNVFSKARTGIFPGAVVTSGTNSPGDGAVAPSTGLSWTAQPFAAVVERTANIGPYLVSSTAIGTGTLATADPSQTRVDRLDVRVFDGALGDNGGVSKTYIAITQGTPGAGVPTAPSNSTPLGWWTLPANTVTLTTGMWTAARKSTGLKGGVRVLLEGDSPSDPGFDSGELRDTTVVSFPATIDRWSPTGNAWARVLDLSGAAVAQNAPTGAMGSTTSTTYVLPTGASAGCTFIVPASGVIEVEWSADIRTDAINHSAVVSPQIRSGATIGSGTILQAASDNWAVSGNAQTNNQTSSSSKFFTGLPAGTSCNVQLLWKVTPTGSAAGNNPVVLVSPQITG